MGDCSKAEWEEKVTDCEDKALRIVLFMLTDQQVAVRAREYCTLN